MTAADTLDRLSQVFQAGAVIVGLLLAAGGLAAFVWAVSRVRGLDVTLDLLSQGNAALRAELADGDRCHAAELERHGLELEDLRRTFAERERACEDRIARLEGQNEALVSGIAERLADRVTERIAAAVVTVVDRLTAAAATTTTTTTAVVQTTGGTPT